MFDIIFHTKSYHELVYNVLVKKNEFGFKHERKDEVEWD